MKEKRAPIAVAVIIVLIAAVGVGAYLSTLGPSVQPTGIEEIPGSTKVSSIGGKSAVGLMSDLINETAGVSMSEAEIAKVFALDLYKSTEGVTDVVNHYKSKWQGEGYAALMENSYDLSAMGYYNYIDYCYSKGDQMVGVSAMTYQNENYYLLYSGSMSAVEELFSTPGT